MPYFCREIFSSMRFIGIVLVCLGIGISSCNDGGVKSGQPTGDSTKAQPAAPRPQPKSKLNDAGTALMMSVVSQYYELKNALVATNAADADKAATQLTAMTDSFTSYLQKDAANAAALKPYLDSIANASKAVTAITDGNCERKRVPFEQISSAVFGMLKNAGLKDGGVYREYCPMAFNSKGAYWLSAESEIKNPYFGKKMLECGEVTDSL
jgi:Protein of unknown function (DUF3347)